MFAFLLIVSTLFVRGEALDGIYATVNDEIITNSDVDEYRHQLESRLLYEDLLFPDEKSINDALKDRKTLIDRLIGEKILDSEAKKAGINITDERVTKEIQAKGGEKHLVALLKQKGLTINDYRNFLKKSLARREVINYFVTSKIKISDDDILDFYVSVTKGAAGQGFEYNLSHILIDPRSTKSQEAARTLVEEAKRAIDQGQSFASVHRQFGSNKDDAFGVFKSGEMLPAIEAAITQLKTGEVSAPVETPMGMHLFRLNSKRVVNNPDFEKRKAQIHQILFTKNYAEQLNYWLSQKRRTAVVKINEKK